MLFRSIARLAAGESLALPDSVVAYLARLREEGFGERLIEVERDSWIMIAAQIEPRLVEAMMRTKHRQFDDGPLRGLYLDFDQIIDAEPDDPRLAAVADRISTGIEAAYLAADTADPELAALDPELVRLLDEAFLESMPSARRLLELLEERGWRGWTMIERAEAP